MEKWLILSFLALFFWGFWAFFLKLSSNYTSAKDSLVFQNIGYLIVLFLILAYYKFDIKFNLMGSSFALFAGIFGMFATFMFIFSLSISPNASTPIIITALYPIIALLLSFIFLNENINLGQGVGIILSIGAIILFYIS